MEEKIKLFTEDNHIIYGVLNKQKDSEKLIIFVHGLTGSMNEHHYFNAVPYFNNESYETFRFNLYGASLKARQLGDCTIKIHTEDIKTVIDHFKDKYEEINIVGHSLGALSIMLSDLTEINKVVLWDPSKGMKSLEEKNVEYNEALGKYILHWGVETIMNEEMLQEWKKYSDLTIALNTLKKPAKFIFAELKGYYKDYIPEIEKIDLPHEHVTIEGATHVFYEEGKEKQLFDETLSYLKS